MTQDLQSKALSHLAWRANQISTTYHHSSRVRTLKTLGLSNVENIPTHVTTRELDTLYGLATQLTPSANVLEIGSYLGASSCYLAAGVSAVGGRLFCVDTWQNETMSEGERDTFLEFQKNTSYVLKHITPIRKLSQALERSDIPFPLQLVFLDGDHSYQGVNQDYRKVSPWLVAGGILAFHDCVHFKGVSKTIGEALASGNWQLVGHVDNLLWLRKIVEGEVDFIRPT